LQRLGLTQFRQKQVLERNFKPCAFIVTVIVRTDMHLKLPPPNLHHKWQIEHDYMVVCRTWLSIHVRSNEHIFFRHFQQWTW